MRREVWLTPFGILIGVSFTVAATALPLSYPKAPLWVWHTLFWGGFAIGIISTLFLIFGLLFRQRPIVQQQNNDFMSLKTVFSKFKEELEREYPEDFHSMGSMIDRQNPAQENRFVKIFGQMVDVDIYGKLPSKSFRDWIIIDKDLFIIGNIKNGSELYRDDNYNVLEFTDLAIKKADLGKSIKESKLSLTDEFISRLYK